MLTWMNLWAAAVLVVAAPGQDPAGATPPVFVPTEEDFEAEWAAAGVGMAEALRAHADWCHDVKLFLDQEIALENLLRFAPDDRETHLLLRHRLQKDGSWMVPPKRKAKKNSGERYLEESVERRAAFIDAFTTRAFGAVEHFAADLTPERRLEVHEIILELDPAHAGVRALRGELLLDGAWVLGETQRAKRRRGEIKSIVKQSFAAVDPIKPADLRLREESVGIEWTATARVKNVRVLSTGPAAECERLARATQATITAFREVMGVGGRPFPVMTVYVLATAAERDRFIEKWPTWGPNRLEDLRRLAGSGMVKSIDVARWDESEEHRLDGTVRHTLGVMLQRDFGVTTEVPWAWEGIGLYLTRELVGTRMTWYGMGVASPAAAHQPFIKQVMDNEVNWVNEGYQRLLGESGPRLEAVLDKPLAELDIYDFLVAYVFAAYLIEGRPEELPELMRRLGRDRRPRAQAFEEILGGDVSGVEARLMRWLEERR